MTGMYEHDVIFPSNGLESDRVDECVEEARHSAEPLEKRDTLCTNMEGEKLNQES